MDRADLERLDRESLVLRAQGAGIRRARVLTRPELVDELLRLDPNIDDAQLKKTRGFFGRARDLLARVVERGLHLPDAAERLRSSVLDEPAPEVPRPEPQAVPTVTLAEIYAAQGHKQRAIETLRRVLEAEPDHGGARALLEKLEAVGYVPPPPPLPPEAEDAPPTLQQEEEDEAIVPSDAAVTIALPDIQLRVGEVRDACVAIPLADDALYVWWRLASGHGLREVVVRAVIVVPTWDGPEVTVRDLRRDVAAGETILRNLPARSIVRVAIGSDEGDAFVPRVHSPALETTRTGGLCSWTLDGLVEVGDEGVFASAVAGAERARRSRLRE